MSKMSAKTRYEAFTEWHAWAKTKYPAFRTKKKKVAPAFPKMADDGRY